MLLLKLKYLATPAQLFSRFSWYNEYSRKERVLNVALTFLEQLLNRLKGFKLPAL
jgi:hypothetical protein